MASNTERPWNKIELHKLIKHGLLITPLLMGNAHAANNETYRFDLPAQPLSATLDGVSQAAHTKLIYSDETVKGLSAAPVKGNYTAQQALNIALGNTGLNSKVVDKTLITVDGTPKTSETTLKTMTVVGDAVQDSEYPYNEDYTVSNSSSATKTDTPIMETPISIQTITQQVIQDRKVTRVDKAVENVSGVYTNVGTGGLSDTFNVRGFRSFDTYRNGMRLQGALSAIGKRETANLERIEVLKGPASLLYGRIETGGMVNMVTKKPLEDAFYAIEQQFSSFDTYRTTADATGAVTADKKLLYRVNLAYESSDSFREYVEGQRVFVAPTLLWKISDKDEVTFEMEYLNNKAVPDNGTTAIGNRPAAIPRSRNLGENGTQSEGDDVVLGYNWKHDFNDKWKLNHRFNAEYTSQDDRMNVLPAYLDANTGTLNRFVFGLHDNRTHTYSIDLNLAGKFDTHGIEHNVLIGGDFYDFWNRGQQYDSSMMPCDLTSTSGWTGFPDINIYNPVHASCGTTESFYPELAGIDSSYEINQKTYGLYIQDQIKLPFNIHILGGMRYDWAEADNKDNLYNRQGEGKWGRVKPRTGIVWQPIEQVSFYGNYMENFGTSNNGVVGAGSGGYSAPPEESNQWETGIKTQWLDGRLTAGLALYQINKSNLTIGCGPRCWQTLGKVRNEGLELDVAGEVLPGLKVIGAYSYIDSEIIGGANDGNRLSNVPRNGGSLWTTYELQSGDLQGLKFGAGMLARDQRQGSTDKSYQLPGYTTVNLLTSYAWKVGSSKLITQLNVDNLLNKGFYSDSDDSSSLTWAPRINIGAPRTFMGSVRLEF
ncbi:MAG: TonB-dependent receptor [Methylobacter sp.]|nr:TonB-dependent receptor [Methylobacter sp.]